MTKRGVMLCGHGSRDQGAVDEFAAVAMKLRARMADRYDVDYGYLEFANPVIRDGLTLTSLTLPPPTNAWNWL